MTILIIAEMREGWSFTACQQVLERMGHRVDHFNVGDVSFPMARSYLWRGVQKISRRPLVQRVNKALRQFLLQQASPARDLVLLAKGEYLLPETVRYLKERTGALLFNWQTDDYFSPTLSSKHAIESIPLYDCIFVHTKANLPELIRRGARRAEYLPHGADPSLYHPVSPWQQEPSETDVVFIGNWRRERQQSLERLVSLGVPYRFAIWGYEWEHLPWRSPLRRYARFSAVLWNEYGRAIRRSKINLVFLTHFDTHRAVAPLRLFEIPAAGGFMLVEKGSGEAEEFFTSGKEMGCFRDADDLRERIDYFLAHDAERRTIALTAQQRALQSGYFYSRKMERMLDVYRELLDKARAAAG